MSGADEWFLVPYRAMVICLAGGHSHGSMVMHLSIFFVFFALSF